MMDYSVPSFSDGVGPDYLCDLFNSSKIPLLIESIDKPLTKQVLYSISFTTQKIELLAHTHSEHDVAIKTVFSKALSSLKDAASTQHQLYFALGRSLHHLPAVSAAGGL